MSATIQTPWLAGLLICTLPWTPCLVLVHGGSRYDANVAAQSRTLGSCHFRNDTPTHPHTIRHDGGSDVDTSTYSAGQSLSLNRPLPPAARMTDISNHARSKVDSARERELYRYYQPNSRNERQRSLTVLPGGDTVTADGATSPDNTLTALAQLAAIRLNAQRAMVR